MTDHPLTETAAAELSKKFMPGVAFQILASVSPEDLTEYARAAFDAGREHERTTPAEPLARTLLGVPEGHGAPHHDADQIRPDDFVAQVDESGFIRAGIAHHQDGDGDWCAENDLPITWALARADRPDALTIWPAPTPPAEEVELPGEHPAHLLDARGWDDERFAYMALDVGGHWCGVDQEGVARAWPIRWIAAFTLPDGTRARRDGKREDGTPRFVKESA